MSFESLGDPFRPFAEPKPRRRLHREVVAGMLVPPVGGDIGFVGGDRGQDQSRPWMPSSLEIRQTVDAYKAWKAKPEPKAEFLAEEFVFPETPRKFFNRVYSKDSDKGYDRVLDLLETSVQIEEGRARQEALRLEALEKARTGIDLIYLPCCNFPAQRRNSRLLEEAASGVKLGGQDADFGFCPACGHKFARVELLRLMGLQVSTVENAPKGDAGSSDASAA